MINGQTGDQLIDLVKQAQQKNALLVFLFHGVGGEHSLNVSLDAHRKLLQYLKQNQKSIWVAPMIDVAEYITRYQSKANKTR
jgi:sialate O-acetylesterase